MDHTLAPVKIAAAARGQEEIAAFARNVNSNLLHLSAAKCQKLTDLCILLTCGVPKDELNPAVAIVFDEYIKKNIGPFQVQFDTAGSVQTIKLGNLTAGSLYYRPMFPEVERRRLMDHKFCYGILPSRQMPNRMLITIGDKTIIGNQSVLNGELQSQDRNNAKLGDYYFNRDAIMKDEAELVRFAVMDATTVVQLMEIYNADGQKKETMYFNHLQPLQDNTYKVIEQEKIEDVNTKQQVKAFLFYQQPTPRFIPDVGLNDATNLYFK